ncbi:MAG: gas vesicle protein K [Beijerinckiaceae bacterium]
MKTSAFTLEPEAVSTAMQQIFRDKIAKGNPDARITLDPDRIEHDIAKLVLTLMEFLRRLLEMQAVRRMENNHLTEDEEERLGLTLMRAEERIIEMAKQFELNPDDLSLDLGPLGKLM